MFLKLLDCKTGEWSVYEKFEDEVYMVEDELEYEEDCNVVIEGEILINEAV